MRRFTWLIVPLALLCIEGGVQAWRHAELQVSKAPVFYWKGAELRTTDPSDFGLALKMYRADRGAEKTESLPEGRKITVFYFEWDSIELGPFIDASGHETEVCNVNAGFKVLQSGERRMHRFENGETLGFNHTLLAQADGRRVYAYKIPWIQGIGEWATMKSGDFATRISRSFLRRRGAGRVLQAGIYGAASEEEAWALFQHKVLDDMEWRE